MIIILNGSLLYYKDNYGAINDYYQYIVSIIKQILINNDMNINISLCENYKFNNNNKTINININCEHTLVKRGNIGENPIGKILDNNNNNYLIRIQNYSELYDSNIIIDYSIPNIYNVRSCDTFKTFSQKHIYISSSIYDCVWYKENRNINTLTTFLNINQPRRIQFLETIQNHTNIDNCFDKQSLCELYKNTKILINIHQTNDHDTFEELRVLPALECGVIVICEHSPLEQIIPYYDYIIWETYENIINKTNEILNNYNYYHDLIFLNKKKIKLQELKNQNYNTLNNQIKGLIQIPSLF